MSYTKGSFLLTVLSLVFSSCVSFHPLASDTQIGFDGGYQTVFHEEAGIYTETYGDFNFAFNKKDYRAIKLGNTGLKNVLFYGVTEKPSYQYFLLLDPVQEDFNTELFQVKKETIRGRKIVLLISKDAPTSDITFILENIGAYDPE